MEQVTIDKYFDEKNWDPNFIKFLCFKYYSDREERLHNKDDVIFILNQIKDQRILELYNITMELRNIHLPDYYNKRNQYLQKLNLGKGKGKGRKGIKKLLDNKKGIQEKIIEGIENQMRVLIRMMERDDTMTWLIYPLFIVSRQLYKFIKNECVIDGGIENDDENSIYLERCIRNIHKCLTMCLNDRNPNKFENKRCGILYFINLEFKIYQILNNKDMIKNLIKVYESRGGYTELSHNDSKYPLGKSQLVTFHYFMGFYYGVIMNDHVKGMEHLDIALNVCSIKYSKQIELILKLLIPLKLLVQGVIINARKLSEGFPEVVLPEYYNKLILLIIKGDIKEYLHKMDDISLQRAQLKDGTFILWQLLFHRVEINYVKSQWTRLEQKSILPLKEISQISECQLSTLISMGYVKGYISHSHGVVVLSKSNPFCK